MSSRPLAQRRHLDRDHVQAVEEVLAEAAVADRLLAGSGWWPRSPARRRVTVFEEPTGSKVRSWSTRSSFTWRFGLMSPISSRKIVPPSASAKRPSRWLTALVKAPSHVAEELGFEQLLGNRAAVHRDEHALGAAAVVVDRARDQLLAGAALARDQHRAVGVGHLVDDVEHAAQRRRCCRRCSRSGSGSAAGCWSMRFSALRRPVLDGLLDERAAPRRGAPGRRASRGTRRRRPAAPRPSARRCRSR